jgi:hypothetical protein
MIRDNESRVSYRELTVAFSRMGRLYGAELARHPRHAIARHPLKPLPPPAAATPGNNEDNNLGHCAALFTLAVPHLKDMDSQVRGGWGVGEVVGGGDVVCGACTHLSSSGWTDCGCLLQVEGCGLGGLVHGAAS